MRVSREFRKLLLQNLIWHQRGTCTHRDRALYCTFIHRSEKLEINLKSASDCQRCNIEFSDTDIDTVNNTEAMLGLEELLIHRKAQSMNQGKG